jgi:hypothetical protein
VPYGTTATTERGYADGFLGRARSCAVDGDQRIYEFLLVHYFSLLLVLNDEDIADHRQDYDGGEQYVVESDKGSAAFAFAYVCPTVRVVEVVHLLSPRMTRRRAAELTTSSAIVNWNELMKLLANQMIAPATASVRPSRYAWRGDIRFAPYKREPSYISRRNALP